MNHPGEALPIAVVPGAETSSFLWPEINHFSSVISWIRDKGSDTERGTHEHELTPFIAYIIVNPEQEEFIL